METTIQILDEYLDYVYIEEGFREYMTKLKEKTLVNILDKFRRAKDPKQMASVFRAVPKMKADTILKVSDKRIPGFKREVDKLLKKKKSIREAEVEVGMADEDSNEGDKLLASAIVAGQAAANGTEDLIKKKSMEEKLEGLKDALYEGSWKSLKWGTILLIIKVLVNSFILVPLLGSLTAGSVSFQAIIIASAIANQAIVWLLFFAIILLIIASIVALYISLVYG